MIYFGESCKRSRRVCTQLGLCLSQVSCSFRMFMHPGTDLCLPSGAFLSLHAGEKTVSAPEMPEIRLRGKEGNLEMVDHKKNEEKQINFEHVVLFFFF